MHTSVCCVYMYAYDYMHATEHVWRSEDNSSVCPCLSPCLRQGLLLFVANMSDYVAHDLPGYSASISYLTIRVLGLYIYFNVTSFMYK